MVILSPFCLRASALSPQRGELKRGDFFLYCVNNFKILVSSVYCILRFKYRIQDLSPAIIAKALEHISVIYA
jgi:hypothetical protein